MTRQEFIEDVTSFGDLIMFCQDNDIDICEDIYDADYLNDVIIGAVSQMRDWRQIYDFVKDIPTDSCYYREDGYGGYEDADYCFEDYKNDVLDQMDANGGWDEEDEYDDLEGSGQADSAGTLIDVNEEIGTDSFMAVLRMAS